jgi:type II secretory ATPase GspE/PulE/Tfp pilus assembly ATPase PilB-like protein
MMAVDSGARAMYLVHLMLTEAIALQAAEVRLQFEEAHRQVSLSFLIAGAWQARDMLPSDLWKGIVIRLCTLAHVNPSSLATTQSGEIAVRHQGRQFCIHALFDPNAHRVIIRLPQR